jgi:hypothetical protein
MALVMLAMMPGLIAGSALTKSTKQASNVATQASILYCAYQSGWFSNLGQFGGCMWDIWVPKGFTSIGAWVATSRAMVGGGKELVELGEKMGRWSFIRMGEAIAKWGGRLLRFTPWVAGFTLA